MNVRCMTLAMAIALLAAPLFADQKDIDFDQQADFSKFQTFTIRQGQITAKSPELNSPLVRKKIEDSPNHPRYIITIYGVGYKFLG